MLKLVKLSKVYQKQFEDMMEEWSASGERIIPASIAQHDFRQFDEVAAGFSAEEKGLPGLVPGTTFFGYDTDRDCFVGAVNIRHYLNEGLRLRGGHIGDGIRPSMRRRGYATELIRLALKECRSLVTDGDKVLMVCDKDNVGSAKSILNNGGILENEIDDGGVVKQRYWIPLFH